MKLQEHALLKEHTTFKIGGQARYFVIAETTQDVIEAYEYARDNHIPMAMIGAGCNLIIRDDQELEGLVLKIATRNIEVEGHRITADAGVSFSAITAKAHQHGLVGLEWFPAVPSSVGGGVRGNAGAFGGETKDLLESVTVLRDGHIVTIPKSELEFRYRYSSFKDSDNSDIILSATFCLQPGDVSEARIQVREYIKTKQSSQPVGVACSGCIFQNYDEETSIDPHLLEDYPELKRFLEKGIIPSGYLIEKAGLKGVRIGGAVVSEKHANYIINPERTATYQDVTQLIQLIKETVHQVFGVWIKEEAVYLDAYLKYR